MRIETEMLARLRRAALLRVAMLAAIVGKLNICEEAFFF